MPCDNGRMHKCNDTFTEVLELIETYMNEMNYDAFILGGDWNTSMDRESAQTFEPKQFIERNRLNLTWNHSKAKVENTYFNLALDHYSCIDHFVVSNNVFDSIICHYVVHNAFNLSSHVPLQIEVHMQTEKVKISENIRKPGINWNSVTDAHI